MVPTPIRNLDDLLAIVGRVESAYGASDWRSTVTLIRKSFYDNGNWDDMIADRASQDRLSPKGSLTKADCARLTQDEAEVTIGGQTLDLGHVSTGLDAQNFPRTAGNAMFLHGPSASTWSGDVGSAVAHWGVKTDDEFSTREQYYEKYVSESDLLADVDGLAISQVQAPIPQTGTLSNRLRAYYGGNPGRRAGVSRRYSTFCRVANLALTPDGKHLSQPARGLILVRVAKFALLYSLKLRGSELKKFVKPLGEGWCDPKRLRNTVAKSYTDEDVVWFSERFMAWIERGLASEPTS